MQELIPLVQDKQISEERLGQLFLYAYQQKWNMQKFFKVVLVPALTLGVDDFNESRYLKSLDTIKERIFSAEGLTMAERAKAAHEMACAVLLNFSASKKNHHNVQQLFMLALEFELTYQDDPAVSPSQKRKAWKENNAARKLLNDFGLIGDGVVDHYVLLMYLLNHGSDIAVSSYFASYAKDLKQEQGDEVFARIKSKLRLNEQYRAFMGYILSREGAGGDVFDDNLFPQFHVRGVGSQVVGRAILNNDLLAMNSVVENFDSALGHSLREQFLVLYCLLFEKTETEKSKELSLRYGFDSLEDPDFDALKEYLPLALFGEDSDAANHVADIFKRKNNIVAQAYWCLKTGNKVEIKHILADLLDASSVTFLWEKEIRNKRSVQEALLSLCKKLFLNWQRSGSNYSLEAKLRQNLFVLFALMVEVYGKDFTLRFSDKKSLVFPKTLFDSVFCENFSEKPREFIKYLNFLGQAGHVPFAPSAADTASVVSLDEAATFIRKKEPYLEIGQRGNLPMSGASLVAVESVSSEPSEAESQVVYQPPGKGCEGHQQGLGFFEKGRPNSLSGEPGSGSERSSETEKHTKQRREGKRRVAC